MASNFINALGSGSGLDSRAIVDGLVGVERTARIEPLTERREQLGARISALGQVRSALQSIATSLDGRVRSGALGIGISSSDASAVAVQRRGLGPPAAITQRLSVEQLASGQQLVSAPQAADAPVGLGTLTISFGRRTDPAEGAFLFTAGSRPAIDIRITPENNTLAGLRDAINASGAGITARIVTSAGQGQLVLRGAEGAESAFIISVAAEAGAGDLARFSHTPGAPTLQRTATAQDARLTLDGVPVVRASNQIDDLVPGARLTLNRTTGLVSLTAARDPSALASTVADFADTLNAMRQLIGDLRNPGSAGVEPGVLAGDASLRLIDQRLVAAISSPVPGANGLRLADLGVALQRDGSISFDAGRLAALPPERLADAEAVLREMAGPAAPGRTLRLQSIGQLAASAADGFTQRQGVITRQISQAEARVEAFRLQLVRQFAAMDAAIAGSRRVGEQIDQQIAFWTADQG
jgi:flagellar hook-associated protein 2